MLGDVLSGGQQRLDPLYESEVRFRRLAALSADIYWEQDETLRFTSFSASRASHIERAYTDKLLGKMRWQGGYLNMPRQASDCAVCASQATSTLALHTTLPLW